MIETVYGEGFRFVGEVERVIDTQTRSDELGPSRPAIAVLPFENRSGDPEQTYFAEGVSDDLLARLTAWRVFPVISRSSSYRYRGAVDPKVVGLELGARYVVDGSVHRSDGEVRVTAQLSDTVQGTQIWADRYTATLDRLFQLQEEICQLIAGAMHSEAMRATVSEVVRREPRDVDAWDQALRGVWHEGKETPADHAVARRHFERACELDPELVFAFANLGVSYYQELFHQWTDDWIASLERLEWCADTCVRLDPREPEGHVLKGLHRMIRGQREEAIASMQLALELNPSLATTQSLVGQLLALGGRPHEARPHVEAAVRLSRCDPRLFLFYSARAIVEYCSDDYEAAIAWARRSARLNPHYALNYGCIAASHAHLHQLEEAKEAIELLLEKSPAFSISTFERLLSSAEERYRRSFRSGLEQAGLCS
jgi:TolB-like protein/TPR repeat protein